MSFEMPSSVENNNNIENKEVEQKVIEGRELKGKVLAGIGIADVEKFKTYMDANNIKYEIYSYEENPTLGLIVFESTDDQYEVFDEVVRNNSDEIKGGFWSDSTVTEDRRLILVSGEKE